jgi:hypothetical protein
MKKYFLLLLVLGWLLPAVSGGAADENVPELFPDLDGWVKDGDPDIYYADNLWEYINGAADMYLRYDFKKVMTLTYDREPDRSITIDVYEHDGSRYAFGIYSRERPAESSFLKIGAQGYYEEGMLNFFQGNYYVKLMGFYVGDDEKSFLESIAGQLSNRLGGDTRFPAVLACFPEKNRVEHSESFIAKDFLGRSVLHSAFVADYEFEGGKKQVFIIEAADKDGAQDMVAQYIKQVEEKGSSVVREEGLYRFEDPYFRSNGRMNLKTGGKYIWGLFDDEPSISDSYINKIEENLKANCLIE